MKKLCKGLMCLLLAFTLCAATVTVQQPVKVEAAKGGYIISNNVNLRKGPGTNYASLGQVQRGTSVTHLGTSGNWYKLKINSGANAGKTGWVICNYVSLH